MALSGRRVAIKHESHQPQDELDGEDRQGETACDCRTHPTIIPATAFRERYGADSAQLAAAAASPARSPAGATTPNTPSGP